MNDAAIVPASGGGADIIERVVIAGDLSKLSAAERVSYYRRTCESLGLNPLTKPFDYIALNGKLTLYAKRDCTDQLRKIHRISVHIASRERAEDVYVVTASATTPDGRTDESIGAVSVKGLSGEALANAFMKAETKAKRRVTLSIVGLGWLDETEVTAVPDVSPVVVTDAGEIMPDVLPASTTTPQPASQRRPLPEDQSASVPVMRRVGASVGTAAWQKAANDLAASEPYYQDKAGRPDFYHMLGAASKCGHAEVTDANLQDVLNDLRQYAAAATAGK